MQSNADDQAVKQRQMACEHTFIRGVADAKHICPRCGLSQADHEVLKASMWAHVTGLGVP